MRRLRELFLGAWRAPCSASLPGTAPHLRLVAAFWPRGRARPGLKQELLGGT